MGDGGTEQCEKEALIRCAQRVPSLYNKSALILNAHKVPPLL